MSSLKLKSKSLFCNTLVLCCAVFAHPALAVDVVDFSKESPQLQLQKIHRQNADLQLQITQFHQDMMSMRGEIERLQYKIGELERARKGDLIKIQQLMNNNSNNSSTNNNNSNSNTEPFVDNQPDTLDDMSDVDPDKALVEAAKARGDFASYQLAFNALKQKKYDKASEGFNSYVKAYPQGEYTPNAYYWLGELSLLANDSQAATKSFTKVITDFSSSNKADDARFKMAQIYNRAGKHEQSKALLKALMSTSSNQRIKELATAFKEEHYP